VEQVALYPLLSCLKAALLIDNLGHIVRISRFSNIITTLFVFYYFVGFALAAGEGHPTGLATPNIPRRAVEVVVLVPVLGTLYATTL